MYFMAFIHAMKYNCWAFFTPDILKIQHLSRGYRD